MNIIEKDKLHKQIYKYHEDKYTIEVNNKFKTNPVELSFEEIFSPKAAKSASSSISFVSLELEKILKYRELDLFFF